MPELVGDDRLCLLISRKLVGIAADSFLNADLSNRDDVAPMVLEKTNASKFGIKSGEGMFSYTPEQTKALQAERARKLVAVRRILEGRE